MFLSEEPARDWHFARDFHGSDDDVNDADSAQEVVGEYSDDHSNHTQIAQQMMSVAQNMPTMNSASDIGAPS
jgi:hypothetical protein